MLVMVHKMSVFVQFDASVFLQKDSYPKNRNVDLHPKTGIPVRLTIFFCMLRYAVMMIV